MYSPSEGRGRLTWRVCTTCLKDSVMSLIDCRDAIDNSIINRKHYSESLLGRTTYVLLPTTDVHQCCANGIELWTVVVVWQFGILFVHVQALQDNGLRHVDLVGNGKHRLMRRDNPLLCLCVDRLWINWFPSSRFLLWQQLQIVVQHRVVACCRSNVFIDIIYTKNIEIERELEKQDIPSSMKFRHSASSVGILPEATSPQLQQTKSPVVWSSLRLLEWQEWQWTSGWFREDSILTLVWLSAMRLMLIPNSTILMTKMTENELLIQFWLKFPFFQKSLLFDLFVYTTDWSCHIMICLLPRASPTIWRYFLIQLISFLWIF